MAEKERAFLTGTKEQVTADLVLLYVKRTADRQADKNAIKDLERGFEKILSGMDTKTFNETVEDARRDRVRKLLFGPEPFLVTQ